MRLFTFVVAIFIDFYANGCPLVIDELNQLKQLNTFVNKWPGLYHDHISTTWTHSNHPNALSQYKFVETLGMVLKTKEKCPCAVDVIQLVDEQMGFGATSTQPGLFGRLNHKLVLKQNRLPNAIDNYLLTGEEFYCVEKYGQCGASVPLKEWFVDAEYDSIFTTNTSLDKSLGVAYKGVLCYIWPSDYRSSNPAPMKSSSIKLNDEGTKGLMSVGILPSEPECPHLNVTNGEWSFNSLKKVPGTNAILKCNPNHSPLHGAPIVVCQKSYKWMPNPATHCVECKSCLPFKHKESAQITYNSEVIDDEIENKKYYSIATTASLTCLNNTGIAQNVADVAVCSANGWIPENLGHCEKVCPPFNIKNGQVLYTDSRGFDQVSNVNRTIATAVCQPTARLVNGSGSALCLEGQWSTHNLGACEWPTCRPIENTTNGHLIYSSTATEENTVGNSSSLYFPGATVRLHCFANYSIKGASESICESQGNWQPTIGHCL